MSARFGLFERFGVELEYMIVDCETLAVRPIADRLLGTGGDVEFGDVTWSNELVAHVIELKTAEPAKSLDGVAERFRTSIREINKRLAPHGAMLLGTGMHPTMDPLRETVLWAHEYSAVYEAFDRIFGCRGHGWANVQSCHLNLPFANDEQFGRLHAAIRMLLPILPALSASSPVVGGQLTGLLDTRLEYYRKNSARVPSVCGRVVPEPVFSEADYRAKILGRIYADLAPMDPAGVLRDEYANARGAIARFGRGSIEIRVLDVQDEPGRDLAILELVVAVLRGLVAERWCSYEQQRAFDTDELADVFEAVIRDGDAEGTIDPAYAAALGCIGLRASAIWSELARELHAEGAIGPAAAKLAQKGEPLAASISHEIRGGRSVDAVYRELASRLGK
ncbi:MAG: glutamate-cysteine ligase family protein [Phycisphaerae bacterium]|nr:glutamate-cysteine ligase family protein [Phycisphaerae bacterium]